jgi:type I site-specific restriction endonuclease
MPELKQRPGDQPLPTPNDSADIQSLVIADIVARRELGRQRYGTALQAHNGRDVERDLYEELLDAAMYQRQKIEERKHPIPGVVLNELRQELRRKDDLIAEMRRQLAALDRQVELLRAGNVDPRDALRRVAAARRALRIHHVSQPRGYAGWICSCSEEVDTATEREALEHQVLRVLQAVQRAARVEGP